MWDMEMRILEHTISTKFSEKLAGKRRNQISLKSPYPIPELPYF
jgi:hypothetical protein